MSLQPEVIYPHGGLVDLIPAFVPSVYAVEFESGVVKVGCSKNVPSRMQTIVKDGATLGLQPARFFFSKHYLNVRRVERGVLDELRRVAHLVDTPEDFPASSEWFEPVELEDVLEFVKDWIPYPNQYGHPVALRLSDLSAKQRAEAKAAVLAP